MNIQYVQMFSSIHKTFGYYSEKSAILFKLVAISKRFNLVQLQLRTRHLFFKVSICTDFQQIV